MIFPPSSCCFIIFYLTSSPTGTSSPQLILLREGKMRRISYKKFKFLIRGFSSILKASKFLAVLARGRSEAALGS
jgi:hypothetical protein